MLIFFSIMMKKWLLKNIHISRLECINHTLFMTKIDTLFMTKTAEKPYPLELHNPQDGGTLYVLILQMWRAMQTCKLRFVGGIVLFFGIF